MDHLDGPSVITRVLKSGRGDKGASVRVVWCDRTPLAIAGVGDGRGHEPRSAAGTSRSWQSWEMGSSPEPIETNTALRTH